jgi:hypothetical protein
MTVSIQLPARNGSDGTAMASTAATDIAITNVFFDVYRSSLWWGDAASYTASGTSLSR